MTESFQSKPPAAGWAERMIFIFVLLIQQNAFVSILMLVNGVRFEEMRGVVNIFNTIGIASSLILIGWIALSRLRPLAYLASANLWPMLYMCLVVSSTLWSIHPEITIRRGVGYILTVIVAALLPLRFGVTGSMKVLSVSFVISALGSFAFVAILPQYGIMHQADLEGCWQGVFLTKNLLGAVMTVAIFVELYLLVRCPRKEWWRTITLSSFVTLLVFSRSMTQLLVALAYVVGAGAYLLWRRSGWRSLVAIATTTCTVFLGFALVLSKPQSALQIIGKDSTLTGRTAIWPAILELVEERPVLGWGYRAMWQPNDATTAIVDSVAGWGVPSSHNAILEIALELGWSGVVIMGIMICLAFRRGLQCCTSGSGMLGWFSLMFFAGTVAAGMTNESLGQNQTIEWLVFSALFFSCGMHCRKVEYETSELALAR